MKTITIFGTRPELIKLVSLIRLFEEENVENINVHTGQHQELIDPLINIFKINIDYKISPLSNNRSLGLLLANIIKEFDDIVKKEKPDLIIIHGDTLSTLGGKLVGFLNNVKVAHIEAGLRTYNLKSPWPEEFVRTVSSIGTEFNFSPTIKAEKALLNEGIGSKFIHTTGNTVIDILLQTIEAIKKDKGKSIAFNNFLSKLNPSNKKIILITAHRRENLDEGFVNLCKAINEITSKRNDVLFLLPMHLNPMVRKEILGNLNVSESCKIIEPLDYENFVFLMSKSYIIMTDSGGIQEEAPSLQKPVIVIRDTTERPELIESGCGVLAGKSFEGILNSVNSILNDQNIYQNMISKRSPFGDGFAAKKIYKVLKKNL
ncbi:UDP-N-acetylglucosamine 2-epimerase (non-hydrolyzing) [Gammaproteobacteria bacterium]|nr:UDP-N-acetylglucosamine 2-epimerase (non-hydrolyzing) [Gammaproteobacteria bacterium]